RSRCRISWCLNFARCRQQAYTWEIWWTWSGSNRRPLPCHGSALPAAPQAHWFHSRLAAPPRQTRLGQRTSTRIGLALIPGSNWSPMVNSRNIFVRLLLPCLIALLAAGLARAQATAGAPSVEQPPVAYASVSELNGILAQLQQTVQSIQSDLEKTRIERWKTDGATKRQTLATVESIQRNLQSALPETIATLSNSPEDLGASFKLYRNLVIL